MGIPKKAPLILGNHHFRLVSKCKKNLLVQNSDMNLFTCCCCRCLGTKALFVALSLPGYAVFLRVQVLNIHILPTTCTTITHYWAHGPSGFYVFRHEGSGFGATGLWSPGLSRLFLRFRHEGSGFGATGLWSPGLSRFRV